MTSLLEMAVEKARNLPPDKQDQAARAILEVVNGAVDDIYILSDEENAAIDEGIAELERGEFFTLEEVRERLSKYRA
jgi:predicted transcriptional regulator